MVCGLFYFLFLENLTNLFTVLNPHSFGPLPAMPEGRSPSPRVGLLSSNQAFSLDLEIRGRIVLVSGGGFTFLPGAQHILKKAP